MKKNKIFLIISFIIVIIITLTVKIYSKSSNENTNSIEKINKISNNEEMIQNKEQTILNVKQKQQEDQQEEYEEIKEETPKVQAFTANNGQVYDKIGTLKIPSLNIEYPILANYTEDLLKISVTKYWGGEPNEVGNLCILGHNYKNSKFFGKLSDIQKNAIIQITDLKERTLEYRVYETMVVNPDDNTCTSQLTNGHTEVTLITCYYENQKGKATKRFVVKARTN